MEHMLKHFEGIGHTPSNAQIQSHYFATGLSVVYEVDPRDPSGSVSPGDPSVSHSPRNSSESDSRHQKSGFIFPPGWLQFSFAMIQITVDSLVFRLDGGTSR